MKNQLIILLSKKIGVILPLIKVGSIKYNSLRNYLKALAEGRAIHPTPSTIHLHRLVVFRGAIVTTATRLGAVSYLELSYEALVLAHVDGADR